MTITSIAIFLVSAATLGLELALVRAFSIGHWHHFSFLVISTALLGFGAGGTCVTIASKALTANYKKTLWSFACGLALTVPIVFQLSQKVALDELQLIWDPRQILYLCAYYLLFFVPFFCAGTFMALAFTVFADKAHHLYFYNMTGSGAGAAAIVALMYGNAPQHLLLLSSSAAFLAALLLALSMPRRFLLTTFILASACIFIFSPPGPFELDIEISENKSLVYYRALPDSETLAVRYSPLGRLDCLRAPAVRHFPGLSIAYQGPLPEQMLLITDADGTSAINHFEKLSDLNCYDHTTSALPYHLLNQPHACIIGAGGGSDVAQALALGAQEVTAVEMNPQIIDLVRDNFADFASGLYERADVKIIAAEGRSFLQTTTQQFDIINISLLDSFTASAAGVYALNESHLYTIEAIDQALRRLRPQGILSITRILKTPPRDSIKMFASITEALRRRGVANPSDHIIMIRSWATATILVSPRPFLELQIAAARRFARDRSFDLVHLPGIRPKDANIYHALEHPVYYESARRILSHRYETFYRNYAYNIRPAADDRPYFFDFFKWKSLPHMIRTMPRRWLPFSEWGYLVLVATLLQAVFASALFILLPLWIARPIRAVRSRKLPALVYFLLLGLAYMFLEMGFIQKMTLLIGHPVFGVAVTLVGFLLFSGCGSAASARLSKLAKTPNGIIWLAVSAIVVIGLIEITLLAVSFEWLVGFSRPIRILLGLGITAPLAFFMGMPFPTALRQLHTRATPLVPWAWGVNGFASVTGAVLGTFLAISLGFTALAFVALACYLL
ncbi:MAG: spermine/spermidine synthase domain-containing protein, partial [Planctomycetota bacterium]